MTKLTDYRLSKKSHRAQRLRWRIWTVCTNKLSPQVHLKHNLLPSLKLLRLLRTPVDLNIAQIMSSPSYLIRWGLTRKQCLMLLRPNGISFRFVQDLWEDIGVDPYYLTHKSQAIGYNPEVILAGRRLNDGMSRYVAAQLVKDVKKGNNYQRFKCAYYGFHIQRGLS